MKYLLDTCTILWMADDVYELSDKARDVVIDFSKELFVSSISLWEIANKHRNGKLRLGASPYDFFSVVSEKFSFKLLPFGFLDCRHLQSLPAIHKDPFDRMLICQAIEHQLAIITDDRIIASYPIKTIW